MEQNFLIRNGRAMCLWLSACTLHVSGKIVKNCPKLLLPMNLLLAWKLFMLTLLQACLHGEEERCDSSKTRPFSLWSPLSEIPFPKFSFFQFPTAVKICPYVWNFLSGVTSWEEKESERTERSRRRQIHSEKMIEINWTISVFSSQLWCIGELWASSMGNVRKALCPCGEHRAAQAGAHIPIKSPKCISQRLMAVPQKHQWGRRESIQQEGDEDGEH